MPIAAKHNIAVVLFDINSNPVFVEEAKKCLMHICMWKRIMEPKDCMQLIVLNTEESNTKYPNIFEATDLILYDPKLVKPHLDELECAKKAKASWVSGLKLAVNELQQRADTKGAVALQILLFTDFSMQPAIENRQINSIISDINSMNAYLYILGPQVKIPEQMTSFEDVKRWSSNLELLETENSNESLRIARDIVRKCHNAVMCDLKIGLDLFKCYLDHTGLKPWRVPLTLGTSLSFRTATVRFLKTTEMPKFTSEERTKKIWKWCLANDVAIEVPYDNVISGIVTSGKFVPFPEDIEKNLKYFGPSSFKIVAFTDLKNILEIYLRGEGGHYVTSEDDADKSFYLLLKVLSDQNKCAIVQRVYMKNCSPKLMVLLPQINEGNFLLVDLPNKHDVLREIREQNVDDVPPHTKIDRDSPFYKGICEYLQKLDVNDPKNADEHGCVAFPLSPMLADDISVTTSMDLYLKKYFGEEIKDDVPTFEWKYNFDMEPYVKLIPPRPKEEDDTDSPKKAKTKKNDATS